jgi:hypothetical protein
MPIDTAKTVMQVQGKQGWPELASRVQKEGPTVLYNGALASSAATFVGHFPWFFIFNYLSIHLPPAEASAATGAILEGWDPKVIDLLRSAFIGLCASSVSDISSNSLRVLKTARQTAFLTDIDDSSSKKAGSGEKGDKVDVSYVALAKEIMATDGFNGLLTRGLQTRLLSNALQGMLFSVLFKVFSSNSK